jgi:hypothetical protein
MEHWCQHWPQAKRDGWTLTPFGKDNRYVILPPKGHEADEWTAEFHPCDLGGITLLIPHWFSKYYPNS